MSLLEIKNLTVKFATAAGSFTAVDGIDVSVDRGEVLAIVGESGSGKSVSMLAVMGLLPDTATITADKMTYDGRDLLRLSKSERRKLIGREITMIFQEPIASLNPSFTAGFQIEEVLRINLGMSKREARARALELFQAVGIPSPEEKLKAYPHQMSGGQSQRVMIAMAIASNPRLLIADEPTTALDVTVQAQILDLMRRLQAEMGMSILFITHDMGVVAEIADDVAVMYAGAIVENAPVNDLFDAPTHPYTQGLLASIPRPDRPRDTRLVPIPGAVPSLAAMPPGCAFAPRCRLASSACETPVTLTDIAPRHRVACWNHALAAEVAHA